MRAKKLIKKLSITLGILALVVLAAWTVLFYRPLEGTVAQVRDCVPRGVDFFVHKADLLGDFEGRGADFPYVPKLAELGRTDHWGDLLQDRLFADARRQLTELRKAFVESQVDAGIDNINLLDEVLGREVQVAGRFGPGGLEDVRWCVYARVSRWVKMGYGWLLENGYSRDALQGVQIANDGEFFKITAQGQEFHCVRYLDMLMLSNDRPLLSESYELAQGNTLENEPLGPSAHYEDGVRRPLKEWAKRIGLELQPNRLEFHLRPANLVPKIPWLRAWGKNIDEDNRNEKILASFVNLDSWRFLSGAMIFEPRSFSLLSHLVVNANKHTEFQRELFTDKIQQRKKWMDQFFSMVPQDACGAAALRLPADDFILEMANDVLSREERLEINEQIKRTGRYKSLEELIARMAASLYPRVGVILRPNIRSADSKKIFKVHNESPFPQWAWVFWVRKDRGGRMLNKPLNDLIKLFDKHRGAFNIVNAYKLDLSDTGGHSDAAFEFAIPQIPGTGNVSVCTYGDYFIFGNSGPFILKMIRALNGKDDSMLKDEDYNELEGEMSPAVNAVAFAWARNLRTVAQHFQEFSARLSEPMDQAWAIGNRGRAEDLVFKQPNFRRFGSKARIPAGEKPAFRTAVEAKMDEMWAAYQKNSQLTDQATLQRFLHLTEVFRTAYIQMEMKTTSLQISGRVLERDYGRGR